MCNYEPEVILIKQYKYGTATINIYGEVNRDELEKATIKFMKRADKCRKLKKRQEENSINGNKDTSGTIGKK